MTTTTARGAAIMDNTLLPILAGGLVLASMLGTLGSFVVWRRMAYFGDTIAHSSLLGVAIALVMDWPTQWAILAIAMSVAFVLTHYSRRQQLEADTLLGIMAHGGLGMGLLVMAVAGSPDVELEHYLFGDIVGIGWEGVGRLVLLAVIVFGTLIFYWRKLLMVTIDPAIATVEGASPVRMQLLLTVLMAGLIAFTVKLTGVLLISALLIIPAAAARNLSRGPKQMAVLAAIIGMVASAIGIFAAHHYSIPASPAMVTVAVSLFLISSLVSRKA